MIRAGPSSNRTSALIRRGSNSRERQAQRKGHSEQVASYKPWRVVSPDTGPAKTLMWDFQLPELGENKSVV